MVVGAVSLIALREVLSIESATLELSPAKISVPSPASSPEPLAMIISVGSSSNMPVLPLTA